MPRGSEGLTAPRVRGAALAVLITTVFAALWGLTGALSIATLLLVVAAAAASALLVAYLRRLARRLPAPMAGSVTSPFRSRPYLLAVGFEGVGIPVSAVILHNAGHPEAVVSAVATIVGLQYFGLVPAFGSWRFAAAGGAMALLGLLSLLIPASSAGANLPGAAVGFCKRADPAGWRAAAGHPARGRRPARRGGPALVPVDDELVEWPARASLRWVTCGVADGQKGVRDENGV